MLLRPSYGIKSISSEGSDFGIVIRHDKDLKLLQRYTFEANPLDGLHRVIVTAPVITIVIGWPGLKRSRPAPEWDNDPLLADFQGLNGIATHFLQHLGDLVKII